jgi:hypothetical protein
MIKNKKGNNKKVNRMTLGKLKQKRLKYFKYDEYPLHRKHIEDRILAIVGFLPER